MQSFAVFAAEPEPVSAPDGHACGRRPSAGLADIERACSFLISEIKRKHRARWRQGLRKPALAAWPAEGVTGSSPNLRLVLEYRLCGVKDDVVRGVAAWQAGLPVTLLTSVPTPRTLLGLQARGARCVSLLPAGAATEPHADALEFLLHDLCHVGKFADPEFYLEQTGFFSAFARALEHPKWSELESELDAAWASDRDHVLADMNGSSVFLFAALKMRLKMAARRKVTRRQHRAARCAGALSADELIEYSALLDQLLDVLELTGELRHAAIVTSTRRDCPRAASLIAAHFRALGQAVFRLKRSKVP